MSEVIFEKKGFNVKVIGDNYTWTYRLDRPYDITTSTLISTEHRESTVDRISAWDERFMDLASVVASWSKDPSTQGGCVLVEEQRHIIATGCNGFPRKVSDNTKRYDNPDKQ